MAGLFIAFLRVLRDKEAHIMQSPCGRVIVWLTGLAGARKLLGKFNKGFAKMAGNIDQTYRYLDTAEDREALLKDMQRVRQDVLKMCEIVPEDQWYAPRYHNWSLASMLGHLQLMDTLGLWLIQLALLGLRIPIPDTMLHSFNEMMAGVYRNRLIAASRRGIEQREKALADFILSLPVDKFTVQVFYPAMNRYMTVEQAIQALFLHHWEEHLRTMRQAEGLSYEPPQDSAS
jgi:hypothetical protein